MHAINLPVKDKIFLAHFHLSFQIYEKLLNKSRTTIRHQKNILFQHSDQYVEAIGSGFERLDFQIFNFKLSIQFYSKKLLKKQNSRPKITSF